jgi:hypothetical protein
MELSSRVNPRAGQWPGAGRVGACERGVLQAGPGAGVNGRSGRPQWPPREGSAPAAQPKEKSSELRAPAETPSMVMVVTWPSLV